MMACFAAGARLIRYLNGYAPPLSLLGRLGTGRLIIPAYDQVFVAPLLAMVVAGAAYVLSGLPLRAAAPVLAWLHAPQWTAPITFALVAFIIASGRPSLRHWRLCGGHRHWHGTAAVQLVKTG